MRTMVLTISLGLAVLAGCGGDAGMELAASDGLEAACDELETGVGEYHADVAAGDDSREDAVTAAFLARVATDKDSPELLAQHGQQFTTAMRKIRADRETEWRRWTAMTDTLASLRDMARKVRKAAINSMTLQDEADRYVGSLVANVQRARDEKRQEAAARQAEKKAQRDALVQTGAGLLRDALMKPPAAQPVPAK